MFSVYKSHYNPLYNKLVELSRNIFFYKEVLLKDNFETRINLIFVHLSILIIIFKERKKKFPQEIFDNIFLNIEYKMTDRSALGHHICCKIQCNMKDRSALGPNILLKIQCKMKGWRALGPTFASKSCLKSRIGGCWSPHVLENLLQNTGWV